MRLAIVWTMLVAGTWSSAAAAQTCTGDCNRNYEVVINEVITCVNIGLGLLPPGQCSACDGNADEAVAINEVITAVNFGLGLLSCAGETPLPSRTPSPTSTLESGATATPTLRPGAFLTVGEAIARDANGNAIHLGRKISTEGVVTVKAGVFANRKLKVFAQDGTDGIMLYHESSADVDAFQEGDRVRVTGVIRQADPAGGDNPARGTVLVDLTKGSRTPVSEGNPLPDPEPVTLAELAAHGNAYTGSLASVAGVRKVSGKWPSVTSMSTQVEVSDDAGVTVLPLRFQKNTLSPELVAKLEPIGEDGSFDLVAIVVQDDTTNDGRYFDGYELWPRGAADIEPGGESLPTRGGATRW